MKRVIFGIIIALLGITTSVNAQWTTSGSNIYYNAGSVSIGTASTNGTFYVSGTIRSTGLLGNLNQASDIGQQLELGTTALSTLRFDSDEWRLYAGGVGASGEIFRISETGQATFSGNIDLGTNEIQFLSASGGNNRIYSVGGSVFGTWTFKSRFDDMVFSSGENDSNRRHIIFQTGDTERMRIDKSTGNIGIGTTTPASKLDVDGGDVYIGSEVAANGTRRQLRIYGYDNNERFYGTMHSNYDDLRRTFDISTSDATQQLKLDASAHDDGKITLMPGTNVGVGIGTLTMGSHKLAVEGSIGAREVIVEATGWPDYVFHADYELSTLAEIEAYIKAKGHLPEVPSAKQVEEEGQHLGEMQQLLLKKIEELTLYTINQEKVISTQQELLNKQQELIKEITLRLEQLETQN